MRRRIGIIGIDVGTDIGINMHDLIIIGGGPAGLSAAIYATRGKLDTLLLEKGALGGQVMLTELIENYAGVAASSGSALVQTMREQAEGFGVVVDSGEVKSITDKGSVKVVATTQQEYEAKAVIIASGASPSKLGIKGEAEFIGRGISFCATCDGFFFTGKDVLLIGGGNSAITEALFLAKLANKVTVVHRRDELRCEKILQERAFATENIDFMWDSVLIEVKGNKSVESGIIQNVKTNETTEVPAGGIFEYIGIVPNTDFADVDKDESGFIIADGFMKTSMEGVFAAGDCRTTPLRQVSTAVADGAVAAVSVEKYIG